MKKFQFCSIGFLLGSLFYSTMASALGSLWTLEPLTATSLTIPANSSGIVTYRVTNQSTKPHTLEMRPIQGVNQSYEGGEDCSQPFHLNYQQSCLLKLMVSGHHMADVHQGGPEICQVGSFQCYQPSMSHRLHLTKTAAEFSVGGTVYGLQGFLGLQNNEQDSITVSHDGSFSFARSYHALTPYAISINSQPELQTCTVFNGHGMIQDNHITDIEVHCSTHTRTVGGTVTGLLNGEQTTVQINGSDPLVISANGNYTFAQSLAQGSPYLVEIATQPNTQTCVVSNAGGTIGNSNIENVNIHCAINTFFVGGVVSGLDQGQSLLLKNNGIDPLSIVQNGAFTFSNPLPQGSTYHVTVATQPNQQTCTVSQGSGTIPNSDVSNIAVTCVPNTTLSLSSTQMALSVTGYTEYGIPGLPNSGLARNIILTNSGSYTAHDLSITYPTWPLGTSASSNCETSLAPGQSCTLTITPGASASSDGSSACTLGTTPVPQNIVISATNAPIATSQVVILGYGCIYQGGYLFALDDSPALTSSIAGKVAAPSDESNILRWSTLNVNTTATNLSDGHQNSNALATPQGQYPAAQACLNKVEQGYTDWYLPAICQSGYDLFNSGSGCGTLNAPLVQNIYANLKLRALGNFADAIYWTSTQISTTQSWGQGHSNGNQLSVIRSGSLRLRCIRDF